MDKHEKNIYVTRAHNLAKIIQDSFNGDLEAFQAEIGVKKETLSKFLNAKSDRPCGDRAARKIESVLGYSLHALDYIFEKDKEVYYVAIGTDAHYTYEIVKALQNEDVVKECSVVLGDIDIWLKVEVESFLFLDVLLAKIVKMPGVKRSKTYFSVKSLRWQREQKESMHLPKKDEKLYFSNGIEEYIQKKIIHHFNEIKELEKGEISIKDEEKLILKHHQIIQGTRHSLLATRNPSEIVPEFDKYLDEEKQLIKLGVISKRLIFLTDDFKDEWAKAKEIFEIYSNIGCEVRFIFKNNWLPSPLSMFWEIFIIIDQSFVCVRRDDQGRVLIKRTKGMINEYTNTFNANWSKSFTLEEIEDLSASH